MEKNDIICVLQKIMSAGADVLNELNLDTYEGYNNPSRIGAFVALIEKLPQIVPEKIYIAYKEFFESFKQLSDACANASVLKENINVYKDSMRLFIECIGEIINSLDDLYGTCCCCGYEGEFAEDKNLKKICPNCKSTPFDRGLILFLEDARIKEAEENFKVINTAHNDCVANWMKYYCPQVKYEIADINAIHKGLGDVIVSSEPIEIQGLYTHQIGVGEDLSVYVLYNSDEENLDFSWKWELDKELCEHGPLVSVIMPCYNHEQFVADAIGSVINQSYKNIEFLIADDGSSDKTPEIMRRYEKFYTKSMYFKDNAGGRMRELKDCVTGKYVALMHSDDIWHKDKIAMQVDYLEKHPECGTCLTWCRNVDQYGNDLPDQLFIQPNRGREEWMRFFWENGNALCNPSVLTKKELYIDKTWQGITGRQLPDFFKWVDVVQHNPIHIITKELTYMRRYQLEGLENTSIESNANSLNVHIEMGVNWPFCLRDMDDEFFINTFRDKFIHKNATTREELLCEKYFLLLNHISPFVQNGALYFFNDFYDEMKECLKEKYNYAIKEYRADARTKGLMDFLKGIAY